jgi:hypothetical protein
VLIDRGLLRYDDRIVDHWPTFAGGDPLKATVTVRQLMMPRAGLPVFERKLGDAKLFDFDALALLASLVVDGATLGGKAPFSRDVIAQATETADAYAVDALPGTPAAFTQGGFRALRRRHRRVDGEQWLGSRMAMYDPSRTGALGDGVEWARNLSNSQAPVRRIGRDSDERVNTRAELGS